MKRTALKFAAAAIFAAGASSVLAQQHQTVISLDTAKKMAAACETLANSQGWKVIIAVVDGGGNLKYLSRMDGAYLGSIEIAQLKAGSSAKFPFSTRMLGEIAQKYVPGIVYVPGLVTFPGGLPIVTAKGEHLGSIGVSGVTADQDEQCAQAGVDAVKSDLNLK